MGPGPTLDPEDPGGEAGPEPRRGRRARPGGRLLGRGALLAAGCGGCLVLLGAGSWGSLGAEAPAGAGPAAEAGGPEREACRPGPVSKCKRYWARCTAASDLCREPLLRRCEAYVQRCSAEEPEDGPDGWEEVSTTAGPSSGGGEGEGEGRGERPDPPRRAGHVPRVDDDAAVQQALDAYRKQKAAERKVRKERGAKPRASPPPKKASVPSPAKKSAKAPPKARRGDACATDGRCACPALRVADSASCGRGANTEIFRAIRDEGKIAARWVPTLFQGGKVLTQEWVKGHRRQPKGPYRLHVNLPGKRPAYKRVADVSDAMLRKLPAKDHPKLAAGSRTKTCALVGNSGNLLLYEHGKEIDAHDLIWRFNGGKTKGFEKVSPPTSAPPAPASTIFRLWESFPPCRRAGS